MLIKKVLMRTDVQKVLKVQFWLTETQNPKNYRLKKIFLPLTAIKHDKGSIVKLYIIYDPLCFTCEDYNEILYVEI